MQFHLFNNATAVSAAIAEWIIEFIRQQLKTHERFTWLLSGGNTPKQLYELLATEKFRHKIDWKKLHIFFGDERMVPFEDERNNGKMAYESLLRHVPVPEAQIHFIATDKNADLAASEYENLLRQHFDEDVTFDLALLGMGDDGHTLSLFPGSSLVHENKRWVVPAYSPARQQQPDRITLTPVVVNRSGCVAFLVTGESKAAALKEVTQGTFQPEVYPAQLIQPVSEELHWFGDTGAFMHSIKL